MLSMKWYMYIYIEYSHFLFASTRTMVTCSTNTNDICGNNKRYTQIETVCCPVALWENPIYILEFFLFLVYDTRSLADVYWVQWLFACLLVCLIRRLNSKTHKCFFVCCFFSVSLLNWFACLKLALVGLCDSFWSGNDTQNSPTAIGVNESTNRPIFHPCVYFYLSTVSHTVTTPNKKS